MFRIMKFYVYIIGTTNPKPRTYVGWSNNIDKRIAEHDINITVKRLIDIFCELQVNSILEKD